MSTKEKDKLLVNNLKANDPKGLEDYVILYGDYTLNVIMRYIKNKDDARDYYHNFLTKISYKIAGYNEKRGTFKKWLYRVIVNFVLTEIETEKKSIVIYDSEYNLAYKIAPYEAMFVKWAIRSVKFIADIWKGDKSVQAFILRFFVDLEYNEIAYMLGLSSTGSARNMVSRGGIKFKKSLSIYFKGQEHDIIKCLSMKDIYLEC